MLILDSTTPNAFDLSFIGLFNCKVVFRLCRNNPIFLLVNLVVELSTAAPNLTLYNCITFRKDKIYNSVVTLLKGSNRYA
jgi:hypothetical protein